MCSVIRLAQPQMAVSPQNSSRRFVRAKRALECVCPGTAFPGKQFQCLTTGKDAGAPLKPSGLNVQVPLAGKQ
jgi:hypothetical protein